MTRRTGISLAALVALAVAFPSGAAAQTTRVPGYTITGEFEAERPPPEATLSPDEAARIAARDPKVEALSERYDVLRFLTGWQ